MIYWFRHDPIKGWRIIDPSGRDICGATNISVAMETARLLTEYRRVTP